MTAITVVAQKGDEIIAVTLYERYLVTMRTLDDIYLVTGKVAQDKQEARSILVHEAESWDKSGWRLADGDPVVRELGKVDTDWLLDICTVGTMINPPEDMQAMLLGIW